LTQLLPAFIVHEITQAEELAKRRRARSVDHAGLEVEEHRAWYVLAARGLVVKHDDAFELRVVVAAVLAVSAKSCARLHMHYLARRSSLEAGSTQKKKERGGAMKRKKLRVVVWHGKQGNAGGARKEMQVARARAYQKRENDAVLPLQPIELRAPCKAR
jgi:hypothetical protein